MKRMLTSRLNLREGGFLMLFDMYVFIIAIFCLFHAAYVFVSDVS